MPRTQNWIGPAGSHVHSFPINWMGAGSAVPPWQVLQKKLADCGTGSAGDEIPGDETPFPFVIKHFYSLVLSRRGLTLFFTTLTRKACCRCTPHLGSHHRTPLHTTPPDTTDCIRLGQSLDSPPEATVRICNYTNSERRAVLTRRDERSGSPGCGAMWSLRKLSVAGKREAAARAACSPRHGAPRSHCQHQRAPPRPTEIPGSSRIV